MDRPPFLRWCRRCRAIGQTVNWNQRTQEDRKHQDRKHGQREFCSFFQYLKETGKRLTYSHQRTGTIRERAVKRHSGLLRIGSPTHDPAEVLRLALGDHKLKRVSAGGYTERMSFRLVVNYRPRGDQVNAIAELTRGIREGAQHQVLLGVTGSGKTFTMAKVIEAIGHPALVLAHNKTLAAQLYQEFKSFFPDNAVEYFVSYYDYYQPEAYIPSSDVYIEKESTINDELDKLRLAATKSLFERRDCVIVASVSCIYGLGSPEAYYGMLLMLNKGQKITRHDILSRLVEILYERNDMDFRRGTFRVRGDVIEIFPTYDDNAYRIEMWGDEIESLSQIDPLTQQVRQTYLRLPIYPKTHYVRSGDMRKSAVQT